MSTVPPESTRRASALNQAGVKRLVEVVLTLVFIGVLLFAGAGKFDWPAAWVYLILGLVGFIIGGSVLLRKNPEVINERGQRRRENIKGWDKVFTVIALPLYVTAIVSAGLDARNGWSSMPLALQVIAAVVLALATALLYWTMATNPYLEQQVRIQDDRGQRVITTGPYRYVRHPMYVSLILQWISSTLLLGSWVAFGFGLLNVLMHITRTALEDRTLQAELPGYQEYAQQTRYRLLPGVW
ncbi:MAG: isoprenylcysteine carboxylmethyltransferase family protein [Anaerolineae bacterium]|nr:isoprenylcysteine carboxylmethyltransferase family protein [Anaerolineae bacterium]